ncbi:MAG: hypothetical protein ACRDP9_00685 [Kribbellaceae bacterium]
MIRRLITVIAATGLAAAGLIVTAPTAAAAGSCSAYIPSRVAVGQPYRAITIRAGSNCSIAQMDWAAWYAYHPTQGLQEVAFFEHPNYSDTWHMYSASAYTPIGRWQWRPEGAYDRSSNPIHQYGPYYTDVRLASYGRVTATRIGARVNVRTSAYRYWGDGAKFMDWASARGQIPVPHPRHVDLAPPQGGLLLLQRQLQLHLHNQRRTVLPRRALRRGKQDDLGVHQSPGLPVTLSL